MIHNIPVKIGGNEVGTAKIYEEIGKVDITFNHPVMIRELLGLHGAGYDTNLAVVLCGSTEVRLEKLTVNVRKYGAIGDGIADDTVAIQQAINESADYAKKKS